MADGKGKRKIILAVAGGVLLLGGGAGGAAVFLQQPASATAEPAEEKLEPGEVVALDPVSVNLTNNNYLKIGIALQTVASGEKKEGASGPDGSKAIDLMIKQFSGRSMEELSDLAIRQQLMDDLQVKIVTAYEKTSEKSGEAPTKTVMGLYTTAFVMQ